MPAVDDPFSIAASLPGQMATLKGVVKDLSVNNTQALSQALAAATAAAASASSASAAATAARVAPGIGSNSTTGFTLSTSYATLTSFGLTVPSGYSRALISVSAFASSTTAAASADRIYVQAVTNGVTGPESISATSTSLPSGSAAAFQSQNLSGLTGGSVIPIAVQAHLATGPGSTLYTNATVTAVAIFLV